MSCLLAISPSGEIIKPGHFTFDEESGISHSGSAMFRSGIIVVVAAAAGWGLSMSLRPRAIASVAGDPQPSATPNAVAKTEKWKREDLLRSVIERDRAIAVPGYNPYEQILSDWSDEEIREALEAALKHPECALSDGAAADLPGFLLGVWMKRDLAAALDWVTARESGSAKRRMIQSLALHWPLDKSAEGVDRLISNPDFFSGVTAGLMVNRAIQQSAVEGAESVKALFRKLAGAGLVPQRVGQDLVVPDGFDFAALMSSPELAGAWDSGPGPQFAQEWFKQDRGAAFDWALATYGVKELFPLIYGNGDLTGDLRWMGSRVESMEPNQREEFLDSLNGHWAAIPIFAKELTAGIKDPVLQEQARMSLGVQGVFHGKVKEAVELLEGVEEPAKRVAALEQLARIEPEDGLVRPRRPVQEDAEQLRSKLEEWQASAEQIEVILNRLHQ